MNRTEIIKIHKIKLSHAENKLFDKIVKQYRQSQNQSLKTQMVDIFTPSLKQHADIIASRFHISASDYLQELYIKFLQFLESNLETKYCANKIASNLNRIKPTSEDIISRKHRDLESITPEEEINQCSYRIDEQTTLQKAEEIVNLLKGILPKREISILTHYLNGLPFYKIAPKVGYGVTWISTIYNRILDFLHSPQNIAVLEDIYFDDNFRNGKEIPSDKILLELQKAAKADKQKQIQKQELMKAELEKNLPPIDVEHELDIMLKTQTSCKNMFTNRGTRTKIQKRIDAGEKVVFKLKLIGRCDTEEFKQEAYAISMSLFGTNVFEFI